MGGAKQLDWMCQMWCLTTAWRMYDRILYHAQGMGGLRNIVYGVIEWYWSFSRYEYNVLFSIKYISIYIKVCSKVPSFHLPIEITNRNSTKCAPFCLSTTAAQPAPVNKAEIEFCHFVFGRAITVLLIEFWIARLLFVRGSARRIFIFVFFCVFSRLSDIILPALRQKHRDPRPREIQLYSIGTIDRLRLRGMWKCVY